VGVGIFQHADPAAARYSAGRQPALLESVFPAFTDGRKFNFEGRRDDPIIAWD